MKDKYEGCYIDTYKDHYAIFADSGEKLAEYDNHKEAKEDIAEWEAEVKNESYIPADTLATGYRFTVRETELLENAIKKHVEQEVNRGVNAMFDTDSEEFKKVGNELYDKSQWWDDMKLTMRIKKTPFPRKNGYTNGDFRPNQKWLMGAIECCKSARDCDYLLKDAYLSVAHDKKLIQNLKSVRDGNPNKYVNVKVVQKWLDNGVTPEKVEKHIEWFKENYIKGLQAKKKEFKKKLNEDHSEISNDPEMEKLLALAGYTIEDLDTINNEEDIELDDDDPIDVNTSREIDAVMDESSKTVETEEDIKFLLKDINKKIEGLDKLVIECANVIEWTKSHVIKDLDKSQKAKDEYSKQVNIFKNKMQKIIAKYVDVNDPDDIKQYKRFFDLMRSPFKGFVLNSKKLNDIEKEAAKELDDSGATYKNFIKAKERIMSVTSSIVDYTKQFKSDDNIPHDSTSYLYQWVVNVFDAVIFPLRDDIIRTAAIVQASCGNAKTGHFRLNKIKDTVNESAYNGYFMCSDFDKKSQNESVDDFDYLMESIFMDIDH